MGTAAPETPPPTALPTPARSSPPTASPSPPPDACVVTDTATNTAYNDLNVAIRSAARGSTITIQGRCASTSLAEGNAAFVIDRSLTLQGVRADNAGDPTLDGTSLTGVVWVNRNLTVSFVDLTITNGNAEHGNGGGLFNDGGVVSLKNTVVTNNRAWVAGGLENSFGGVMTLTNTTVRGNRSTAGGGGIYNAGTLTITGSLIGDNTSETGAGGGIFNFSSKAFVGSGTLAIQDSTIDGNRSGQSGGGLFNAGSEAGVAFVSASNSALLNNQSGANGGGISSAGQLEFLGPMTIGGNRALRGGGMWVSAGLATGSCPTALGGLVSYEPRNAPTDYDGVGCADQESREAEHSVELNEASDYAAQIFATQTTGALTSVTLLLEHTGLYTQRATVQLQPVTGGVPTGEVLARATPRTVTSADWLTFGFEAPASLVDGTEYAIVLIAPTPPWAYSNLDPYPAGHAVVNGIIQPTQDFAFITWVAP